MWRGGICELISKRIHVGMPVNGVAFSDGIESDVLYLTFFQKDIMIIAVKTTARQDEIYYGKICNF